MKPFLEFVVPGEPQPWQRAGATIIAGHVHHYTKKETDKYEDLVAHFCRQALAANPGWQAIAQSAVRFRIHWYAVTTNPGADVDNVYKSLLDGMMRASDYLLLPPKKPGGRPRKEWIGGPFRDDRLVKQGDQAVDVRKDKTPRLEVYLTTATEPIDGFLWQHIAAEHGWTPPPMTREGRS